MKKREWKRRAKEAEENLASARRRLAEAAAVIEAVERGASDSAERVARFMDNVRMGRALFRSVASFGHYIVPPTRTVAPQENPPL